MSGSLPFHAFQAALLDHGCRNKGASWQCPAHEDRSPSLSIREGDDGRVLVHCFAGCSIEAICEALGWQMADLFPDGRRWQPDPRLYPPWTGKSHRRNDGAYHVQPDIGLRRDPDPTDLEEQVDRLLEVARRHAAGMRWIPFAGVTRCAQIDDHAIEAAHEELEREAQRQDPASPMPQSRMIIPLVRKL